MATRNTPRTIKTAAACALAGMLTAAAISCAADRPKAEQKSSSAIAQITGMDHIEKVLANSSGRLLVFDLYADWCMPCKILSPMLEQIAATHGTSATFYKIDIDKHPDISQAFGVQGIPFVVFVKDRAALEGLTGVHPKETYVRLIERLTSEPAPRAGGDTPDGALVAGVRVIKLNTSMAPGNLYVYRGDTVNLVFEKVAIPYSVHIPSHKVSASSAAGKDLVVGFKADSIGVFPMFCNGDCPAGDGAGFGQIVVLQYEGGEKARFKELSAEQAREHITKAAPLVLDVRTPNEFYDGHIEGATLIPVQQLDGRISEIESYRNKPVLVYCRSGNRSTVAAQMLIREGFTDVSNLRPGIKGWMKLGYPLVTR